MRIPTVFTAPERVDCPAVWLIEHKLSHSTQNTPRYIFSRLAQAMEAMMTTSEIMNYINSMDKEDMNVLWEFEKTVKSADEKWGGLTWSIVFSIIFLTMKDCPNVQEWEKAHLTGWTGPVVAR